MDLTWFSNFAMSQASDLLGLFKSFFPAILLIVGVLFVARLIFSFLGDIVGRGLHR